MGNAYLVGAIFFICIAHFVRILRWELFIDIYEKSDRKILILSMCYGYLLNYVLPFKLGELVRAWISGRKMKNGKALGFSTVIVDRYLDIVTVGAVFIIFSFLGVGGVVSKETAVLYMGVSIVLLVAAICIFATRGVIKKAIRVLASIFNSRIESAILGFAWALIWNFKDIFQKINKIKLAFTTLTMWLGYLVSYYFFAEFLKTLGVGSTWVDVFMTLFTQNGIKGEGYLMVSAPFLTIYPMYMVVYMMLPTVILLIASLFVKRVGKGEEEESYLRLLPHMDPKERLEFLETYFSDKNRDYVKNYLKINQEVSIIRDYSAGSNATTMLCMDGKRTFFRKYAFGEDGEKLFQQILWIEKNYNSIALPNILKQEKTEIYCYYDMPYSSNAVALFEYAHSMPIEQTWELICNVLESLEKSLYTINVRAADKYTIQEYIESKVKKNLKKIKSAKRIKELQKYETLFINGIEYKNLSFYEKYLSENFLQEVFEKDCYTVIHGDLTIENIICTRDKKGKDDFYIIDPNTGNVHESPNLDYGKLLQSIHGGYEFLMSTKEVNITNNRINFLFTKSSVYIELHKLLRNYMEENLGRGRTRSIYFHEIIHWLRLMPYKIEKDGKRAVLFYAGMLMVMKDVIEFYGDNNEGKR